MYCKYFIVIGIVVDNCVFFIVMDVYLCGYLLWVLIDCVVVEFVEVRD